MNDPLFDPGWIAFNEKAWGLRAEVVEFGPEKGTAWALKTVLYKNKRGALICPPRNPYLPVEFLTETTKGFSLVRRKRIALEALVKRYQSFGVRGAIPLSPDVDDVRPFTWSGYRANPRYTFLVDLASFESSVDSRALKKAAKALELGYSSQLTDDLSSVQECLQEPEDRKGFTHAIDLAGLRDLRDMMGQENFICALTYNKSGDPVGARILLCAPGGRVLAWSAGVKTSALRDGVNNLLGVFVIRGLVEKNYKELDLVGANIPPVAEMKEAWGGKLVQYFSISEFSWRSVLRDIRDLTARRG